MFTRQHYEKLARHINENECYAGVISGPCGISDLCKFFKQDNPRFNSTTFRNACGLVWNSVDEIWEVKR